MAREIDRDDPAPLLGQRMHEVLAPRGAGTRETVHQDDRPGIRVLPALPDPRKFAGMDVLVIGATGTIGAAVCDALEARGHTVVRVGRSSGPYAVDLGEPESIRRLYHRVGTLDAVVCAAGIARFGSLSDLSDDDWSLSLRNKLMGQVHLVRIGRAHVRPGGSFTLTSGDLSTAPEPGTVAVTTTGAAVEAFVRAAAVDLAGRFRVNAVSPGPVSESLAAGGGDPASGIPAGALAEYYVRCVEGTATGVVEDARAPAAEPPG
jgi:NAD(P)-dependent dehydrogenase (short-subunit alcohol dehydrogenase family)